MKRTHAVTHARTRRYPRVFDPADYDNAIAPRNCASIERNWRDVTYVQIHLTQQLALIPPTRVW